MNETLIVDASVIVKAFVQEAGSDAAGALWSSEARIAAPAHALAEVGEAIRRKWRRNEITAQQWDEISSALPGSFLVIALDECFAPATRIARELSHGFYDCLYLAAAEHWDCRLVTADRKLVNAVAQSKWQDRTTFLPEYPINPAK